MAQQSITSARPRRFGVGKIFFWLMGIASFALLAYLLAEVAHQLIVPPPAHRIVFVKDIPLPSGRAVSADQTNSLAPGISQDFDKFDFQALDPQTHKLFIAHSGQNPDLLTLSHIKFDPKTDGHVLVFDTSHNKLVARINIPRVAGIVVAPDMHKVYAAAAESNIVYSIDENTLKAKPIELDDNASPDALEYDPIDHKIFVSGPGAPTDPAKSLNRDKNNQNVIVIDAQTDTVITKINIGNLPKLPSEHAPAVANNVPTFGYDIGHNKYDADLHRIFVTIQISPNRDDRNPFILPPPGTGELVSIDPVANKIVQRLPLPVTCSTPHGMALDTQQQVAFIACTDFDSARNLVENLLRVDLRTMKVIPADPLQMRLAPGSDIVLLDHRDHIIFVACKGGISVFDEKAGEFHKLGDYILGKATHTIAIDEQTRYIYLPLTNAGGRPILRIAEYNPNGV